MRRISMRIESVCVWREIIFIQLKRKENEINNHIKQIIQFEMRSRLDAYYKEYQISKPMIEFQVGYWIKDKLHLAELVDT